jgi:voltage-gated potassium channel
MGRKTGKYLSKQGIWISANLRGNQDSKKIGGCSRNMDFKKKGFYSSYMPADIETLTQKIREASAQHLLLVSQEAEEKIKDILAMCYVAPLIGLLVLVIVILGRLIGFREGWSRADSAYYAFITATTVGYGDFHPKKGLSKMLAIAISFVGIILTGIIVALALHAASYAFKNSPAYQQMIDKLEQVHKAYEEHVGMSVMRTKPVSLPLRTTGGSWPVADLKLIAPEDGAPTACYFSSTTATGRTRYYGRPSSRRRGRPDGRPPRPENGRSTNSVT